MTFKWTTAVYAGVVKRASGHFTFVGQATKIPKDAQRLWTVNHPKEDLSDANRHCQQHIR
jgi:hypothetical protein